jgi:peptidoglycan/LPS O-acetylase OafA/YrhL
MKRTDNSTRHHMPQLDGLRAFAVGAVLIYHFFSQQGLAVWTLPG